MFHLNFAIQGGYEMDLRKERCLLMIELDDYYNRLEVAERYDNFGEREWYKEMISLTEAKLMQLEQKAV